MATHQALLCYPSISASMPISYRVVSMEPMPELPDGAPNQPLWHRAAMQRVASDALNLTGATLHPRRREMHVELRSQLHRVLSAHKHKKKKGVSSVGARQRNKERGGSKGSGGRSKSLKKDLLKEKKRDMKHSQAQGVVQPPRHREPPPKRSWFGGAKERKTAITSTMPLTAARCPRPWRAGDCLTSTDVDVLAQSDTEFMWRHGFGRLIPGSTRMYAMRSDRRSRLMRC